MPQRRWWLIRLKQGAKMSKILYLCGEMKKVRHILYLSLPVAAVAALCALLLSSKADWGMGLQPPRSPFPLPPVPRLTNEASARPEFEVLDRSVERFLQKWQINGASLAIAKDGRLLYAKGFGYADVEQQREVQPYHLFRVASVSKLITAAAVMKLAGEGRLALDDHVFGAAGILCDSIFQDMRDWRALQVTVKNLLEHSGGWTTKWGDPLFMGKAIADARGIPLPVGADDIIRFVLSKHMHFDVGSRSSYVNVGYLMLGRVIEKVTGMPYEDYVRDALLTPMGIADMQLGNSYPKDFYRDEVRYYDVWDAKPAMAFDDPHATVDKPSGGYDIRTLGAAGGWVASPAALVRFALCIDGSPTVPDVLPPEAVDKMVCNDSGFDPLGWRMVTARRWLRTGTLAGTSAVLERDTAGYCWAFVTNTGSWKGATFAFRIEAMVNGIIARESPKWAALNYDLFTLTPPQHVLLRP